MCVLMSSSHIVRQISVLHSPLKTSNIKYEKVPNNVAGMIKLRTRLGDNRNNASRTYINTALDVSRRMIYSELDVDELIPGIISRVNIVS